MTIEQIMNRLGLKSPTSIYAAIQSGELKATRDGQTAPSPWNVDETSFETWARTRKPRGRQASISEETKQAIREMYHQKHSMQTIADRYHVSLSYVSLVIGGKR